MLENSKFLINTSTSFSREHPWENMKFNNRKFDLPSLGGIACFRKVFNIDKPVSGASITATALGVFEVYINGKRVGGKDGFDELKPGWTDYKSRVFAFTYDVSEYLVEGENTVIGEVSSGWYSGRISFGLYGFKHTAFRAELDITLDGGEKLSVNTDESWQTAINGPYLNASIWDGVLYDARIDRNFADWKQAVIYDDYEGEITEPQGPPIKVREHLERTPRKAVIYEGTKRNFTTYGEINTVSKKASDGCEKGLLKKGQALVLDLKQNMVGRPYIKVKASKGTRINIYVGEFLNDSGKKSRGNDYAKGSVYIKNYRSAMARCIYIATDGEQSFAPCHTFYGFRYLEISADADIEILEVKGQVIGSANRETGTFTCSDEKVNRFFSNVVWGLRGNYLSIPTDCPQRDERLGWTGDAQMFFNAGSYIADTEEFFRKWLKDMRDCQNPAGGYCDTIPNVLVNEGNYGNAAWGDAGVIIPYQMYLKYGNPEVIEECYESMEKYLAFLKSKDPEGPNPGYCDWLCYEKTDGRYIADAYYANSLDLMAKMSAIIGREDRSKYYASEHARIKKAFIDKYIDSKNSLKEKTQTAYLLAFAFDLLPEELRESHILKLRKKIEDNDYTLSTGFVGTCLLNQTLDKLGLEDLCYSLLLQEKDPSWLYSVNQGATTVWERWNSYTLDKGFGDVGMNSFNHYAYGAVAQWLFEKVAGIATDENHPGFARIILEPKPDMRKNPPCNQERITFANASYDSRAGMIKSGWKAEDGGFVYDFEIPEGVEAQVILFKTASGVTVNGEAADAATENGKWSFVLKGGKYTVKA